MMLESSPLDASLLKGFDALEAAGRISALHGGAIEVEGLRAPLGAQVAILDGHGASPVQGEVVHCSSRSMLVYPLQAAADLRVGNRVVRVRDHARMPVGDGLFGRTIDGLGRPIDGKSPLRDVRYEIMQRDHMSPRSRTSVREPLVTGVRVVDAMLTIGRGQRMGVFAPPGVGKTTLLDMMCAGTEATIVVRAIVGERGHEVGSYLRETCSITANQVPRITVASTSDEPAMVRVRSAYLATALAERLRDQGRHVLLVMDSVTRFCHALREIGLAAGQMPVAHGYPPSVFTQLPLLLERPGCTPHGSITALYAILAEDEDADDPVSDACRGILDGHILLSRRLAERGQYPAIDVLRSISRSADAIIGEKHQRGRAEIIRLLADYASVAELLEIGGYKAASHAPYDVAIRMKPAIDQLFMQGPNDPQGSFDLQTIEQAVEQIHSASQKAHADLAEETSSQTNST